MNNNNGIYTNTFIGTSHLDSYKSTSKFIIATSNILENQINNSSNNLHFHWSNTSYILEEHLSNTSNILEKHSSNYTYILRYDVNKWINEEIFFNEWNSMYYLASLSDDASSSRNRQIVLTRYQQIQYLHRWPATELAG